MIAGMHAVQVSRGTSRFAVRLPDLVFMAFIIGLSLTGLVSYQKAGDYYYKYNLLPANTLFDLFIVVYVLAVPATRITRGALVVLMGSSLYVLFSALFLPAPVAGAPTPTDIIVAFKPFIYLAVLSFARPRGANISLATLERGFKFLLLVFLLKYLLAKAVFGIPRPGIFSENNFELSLLLVLFIFLSRRGRLGTPFWAVLLLSVVLLSGSRSGLLALVAAFMTSARSRSTRVVIAITVIPAFLLLLVTFVDTRISGLSDLTQVDRFVFMTLFLEELQRFDFWNYWIGWGSMTPLSNTTCSELKFYASLFSSGNPEICYPVILHVFYFRMMLDHGILGLAFVMMGFYVILRANGLSRSLALALLLQGLINGLSVSGLANTYFVLGVVLICSNYSGARIESRILQESTS